MLCARGIWRAAQSDPLPKYHAGVVRELYAILCYIAVWRYKLTCNMVIIHHRPLSVHDVRVHMRHAPMCMLHVPYPDGMCKSTYVSSSACRNFYCTRLQVHGSKVQACALKWLGSLSRADLLANTSEACHGHQTPQEAIVHGGRKDHRANQAQPSIYSCGSW